MNSRPVIFVVILVLVLALVYSSVSISDENLFSKIRRTSPNCEGNYEGNPDKTICCWSEMEDRGTKAKSDDRFLGVYCQTCTGTGAEVELCEDPERQIGQPTPPQPIGPFVPPQDGVLEQPPMSQPLGPFAPLQGGVLEEPTTPDESGPPTTGQGILPQDGVLQQQPPAEQGAAAPRIAEPPIEDEESQPLVEEEPLPRCPEDQVLDEETGLCVLEELEADVQEQAEPENQPSNGPAQDSEVQEQAEPENQPSGQEKQPPAEEDENNN